MPDHIMRLTKTIRDRLQTAIEWFNMVVRPYGIYCLLGRGRTRNRPAYNPTGHRERRI